MRGGERGEERHSKVKKEINGNNKERERPPAREE